MYRPLLKYCGNRSFADWKTVMSSSCDYVGLIFAESKRKVTSSEVKKWIEKQPVVNAKKIVGVFVNESVENIVRVAEEVPLDVIQCHGKEPPLLLKELKTRTKKEVWKVIHHGEHSLSEMKLFHGVADGYVIDSKQKGKWGGTGISFDWSHIPSYINEASAQAVPCWIAGGVNANNIHSLLNYEPFGIDIASGIEEKERKDETIIRTIEKRVYNCANNVS
ncbi:phosphoribosylanthranilate isomerase [Bacillus salitolerans]|uniref:N-(5'-phosphoribosyl)anthranilate isomerase n=1 Tax=Bacillus salitolerans TaxID=1437434 RepID=A0ABW4LUK4_9BACI